MSLVWGTVLTSSIWLPKTIGGPPIECDASGDAATVDDELKFVDMYKDSVGRIKRQAAKFRVFEHGDGGSREIDLNDAEVEKIVWTVHIANKKPIWFTFSELLGDLEFGEANSYVNQHVPVNNPDTLGRGA